MKVLKNMGTSELAKHIHNKLRGDYKPMKMKFACHDDIIGERELPSKLGRNIGQKPLLTEQKTKTSKFNDKNSTLNRTIGGATFVAPVTPQQKGRNRITEVESTLKEYKDSLNPRDRKGKILSIDLDNDESTN